jgi:hypothetical protein
LGNGVAVGAIYQVLRAAAERDGEILKVTNPALLKSITKASISPKDQPEIKKRKQTAAS